MVVKVIVVEVEVHRGRIKLSQRLPTEILGNTKRARASPQTPSAVVYQYSPVQSRMFTIYIGLHIPQRVIGQGAKHW